MLQVFHTKWHNGLSKGESSEGYNIVVELRGSSVIRRDSEDRAEIKMFKESLRQRDEEMW
jgi:hypothetical protein